MSCPVCVGLLLSCAGSWLFEALIGGTWRGQSSSSSPSSKLPSTLYFVVYILPSACFFYSFLPSFAFVFVCYCCVALGSVVVTFLLFPFSFLLFLSLSRSCFRPLLSCRLGQCCGLSPPLSFLFFLLFFSFSHVFVRYCRIVSDSVVVSFPLFPSP